MTAYCNHELIWPNSCTITLIANGQGMSAVMLNRRLYELGIQFKQSSTWMALATSMGAPQATALGRGVRIVCEVLSRWVIILYDEKHLCGVFHRSVLPNNAFDWAKWGRRVEYGGNFGNFGGEQAKIALFLVSLHLLDV